MALTTTTDLVSNSSLTLGANDNALSAAALQSLLANIISQPGDTPITPNGTAASTMVSKTVTHVDLTLSDPIDALELQLNTGLTRLGIELSSHITKAHGGAFKAVANNARLS